MEILADLLEQLGEKDATAQQALRLLSPFLWHCVELQGRSTLTRHAYPAHWATNGIYTILNADKLAQHNGEIRLNDLAGMLYSRKYPAHMHRPLLDLMKNFDPCFSFPDDEAHYLIPELLDKQEPEETAAFSPQKCLNFQYTYPYLLKK